MHRLNVFGLSITGLIATGLAAITATIAASFFGVAGTVVGAALVSVVTAAGKEVYSQSLRTTGNRVRAVVPVTRSLPVAVEPAEPATSESPPELPSTATLVVGPVGEHAARNARWRRVLVGTMAVFVAVLAVITGVEIVAGRPVSDLVRGEQGGGTSFFGGNVVRTKTVPPTAPTVTMTVTPKVVVTTPTVTQTAPPTTQTNTPGSGSATTPAPDASTSGGTTGTTGTPSTTERGRP